MSGKPYHTTSSTDELVSHVLSKINNSIELANFKRKLDAEHQNPKLANAYRELQNLGLTIEQICEKLGLEVTPQNIHLFIKKYATIPKRKKTKGGAK